MEEKTEYKYDAFISYRHLPADQAIAESLQKEMERFQVPKNISPKLPLKHRVFRDRVELSTGDLSESIRKGLEQSRYLIVVCSKRTKLSPWCLKEIALFRKLHGDERIIAVLTEGEPSESFPPALLELKTAGLDAQGNPQKVTREILAADVRPTDFIQSHRGQVLSYEALEAGPLRHRKYLKEALALLRKREIYRIIAGMLDLSLGDLKQRDRERRLRRLAIASSAIGLSLFLFSIAILSMYFQANAAKKETRQQNSLMMLENADRKLEEGGRTNAILIADEALAGSEKAGEGDLKPTISSAIACPPMEN